MSATPTPSGRTFLHEKRKFNYVILALLLFGIAFLSAIYLLL